MQGGGGQPHSAEVQSTRGRKQKKARDRETPEKGRKKTQKNGGRARGGGRGSHKAQRPRAPRAGNKGKPGTTGCKGREKKTRRAQGGGVGSQKAQRPRAPGAGDHGKKRGYGGGRRSKTKSARAQGAKGREAWKAKESRGARGKKNSKTKNQTTEPRATPARRGPNKEEGQNSQRKGEAHQNAPGRPACPTRPRRARTSTHAHRCWRPHQTAPVHQPSPPSKSRRYGKPDASVTGSTHENKRSARSPRLKPEGPARDNPIAGPRMGTKRSESSALASAGASGRHKEPGSRRASTCPAQPPSKAGCNSLLGWGKAPRRRESRPEHQEAPDRTRRGAPTRGREARQRGTLPATTTAQEQNPSHNGRRVPRTPEAHTTHNEPQHRRRWKRGPAAGPKRQEVGGERAPVPGRPTPRQEAPPPRALVPPPQPQSQHTRVRAVGLVTNPHACTPRTHSQ